MRPLTWGKRYLFGDEFDFLLLSFTNQKCLKLLKIFWPRFLLGSSAIRLVGECHSVNTEKNYLKGKKNQRFIVFAIMKITLTFYYGLLSIGILN